MSRMVDMTGLRFGRLTVISRAGSNRRGLAKWKCECSCGNELEVMGASLRNGNTKSCGCSFNKSHGDAASGAPEYTAWESMIARCENKRHVSWHDYGGRGIKVAPEWRRNYPAFLKYVGRRPTPQHTLDRYPNNDGHYEPGNVRWATRSEQNANQRKRIHKKWREAAKHAYSVVRSFEYVLQSYTEAPHVVTCDSCTDALLLAVAWHCRNRSTPIVVEIPRLTYCSVPMSIKHAGAEVAFRDESWLGSYQLKPLPVFDCARHFTSGMYRAGTFMCVSFHWSKHLPIGRGGAILCDDRKAAEWLKRARFDGRSEGKPPKNDKGLILGWHSYLTPDRAAMGLMLMASIAEHNDPLPNDPYPDLSQMEIFK